MGHDALAIFGSSDGRLCAFRGTTGSVCWEHRGHHRVSGMAHAPTQDAIITAALDGTVASLRLDDGAWNWQTVVPGIHLPAGGGQAHVRVVVGGDVVGVQYGKRIIGVHAADGRILWEHASTAYRVQLLAGSPSHVYLVERDLLPRPTSAVPADSQGSPAFVKALAPVIRFVTLALSPQDGTLQWSSVEASAREAATDGATPLSEAAGTVFTYGPRGLSALTADGKLLWTHETPQFHIGALAIEDIHLVLAAGAHAGTYRTKDGALMWSLTGRHEGMFFEHFSQALIMEHVAYVARCEFNPSAFHIEARDLDTGSMRMVWPDVAGRSSNPEVAWRFCGSDGMLYVPDYDGLHAIRVSDRQEVWRAELNSPFDALLAVPTAG